MFLLRSFSSHRSTLISYLFSVCMFFALFFHVTVTTSVGQTTWDGDMSNFRPFRVEAGALDSSILSRTELVRRAALLFLYVVGRCEWRYSVIADALVVYELMHDGITVGVAVHTENVREQLVILDGERLVELTREIFPGLGVSDLVTFRFLFRDMGLEELVLADLDTRLIDGSVRYSGADSFLLSDLLNLYDFAGIVIWRSYHLSSDDF
jgi:hypothetical protein